MRPANKRITPGIYCLVFTLLCVLAQASSPGATGNEGYEDDPFLLHEEAQSLLQDGRIDAAEEVLDQLRRLISTSPGWDPDGTFHDRFLPDLAHRIANLKSATSELDTLYHQEWASKKIPESVLSSGDVRRCINWTTDTVFELSDQRIAVVNQLDPTDKAILYETPAYRRIQLVLETGVVQRAHEFTREVVKRMGEEDARFRALRTRLDSLNRGTIDLIAQREKLTHELRLSRERVEKYLDALASLVTEGVGASSDSILPQAQEVDQVFFALLNRRIEAMKAATSQTSEEKKSRQKAVDRYLHYNRVLVRAQVILDQETAITELDHLINDLPVRDAEAPASAEAAAGLNVMVILLGGGALLALSAWVIWLRERRGAGHPGGAATDRKIDLHATDNATSAGHDDDSTRPSADAP